MPVLWWSPTGGLIRGGTNGGYDDAVRLVPDEGGDEYERGLDEGYRDGKRDRTTPPTPTKLHAALAEIAEEARGSGAAQIGAALALGALAEACDLQPGGEPEDIASALGAAPAPEAGDLAGVADFLDLLHGQLHPIARHSVMAAIRSVRDRVRAHRCVPSVATGQGEDE